MDRQHVTVDMIYILRCGPFIYGLPVRLPCDGAVWDFWDSSLGLLVWFLRFLCWEWAGGIGTSRRPARQASSDSIEPGVCYFAGFWFYRGEGLLIFLGSDFIDWFFGFWFYRGEGLLIFLGFDFIDRGGAIFQVDSWLLMYNVRRFQRFRDAAFQYEKQIWETWNMWNMRKK